MNGLVLDKKRLRTMIAGVFTVFATAVPFLLTLYSASSDAVPVYGQIANNSAIYAYRCAQLRTKTIRLFPPNYHGIIKHNAANS
jgi:hypothetical protein